MPTFGQLVIGPPGAGKSTYCAAMQDLLTALGRSPIVVNLDPANDALPYDCDVDVVELVSVDDVMECLALGPNGGLIAAIEFLAANVEWLHARIDAAVAKKRIAPPQTYAYVLFDCPGQIELYTHHSAMAEIVRSLEQRDFRLTCVQLIDSFHCSSSNGDPAKFISVVLSCLSSMMHLAMPHVCVLSKIDLLDAFGEPALPLDFFTDVLDLRALIGDDDESESSLFWRKYRKLACALADVIDGYGLVHFLPLNVQEKESVLNVLREVDKANGHFLAECEDARLYAPGVTLPTFQTDQSSDGESAQASSSRSTT